MTQEFCCSKSEGYSLIRLLNLHESSLGYLKGADRQYRDSRSTKSIHAREFDTKFCFHLDNYNPEQRPIEHLFDDVIKPEALIAGGFTFPLALAITKKPKSAFWWALDIGTLVQSIVDNNGA